MADADPTLVTRTRKSTGSVLAPNGTRRSWTLRFRAYGKRHHVTLGRPEEGWDRRKAEAELENVLAAVRLGVWDPHGSAPDDAAEAPAAEETFHVFASRWLESKERELRERTRVDYTWRLEAHLLPYFAAYPLSKITVRAVDEFREAKLTERERLIAQRKLEAEKPADERRRLPRPMSNGSINKLIRLLAAIMEQAVEWDLIPKNPAKGRNRLLREERPARTFLQPPQVVALLDAAGELDRGARKGDTRRRRALIAVLTLGGLRIGEALDLCWRDVSLAGQRLRVTASKTDAGVRDVVLSPALRETLTEYRAQAPHTAPDDLVFGTAAGKRDSDSNVRTRYLAPAIERANEGLERAGAEAIGKVTPHSLRRTFISLLAFAGVDLKRIMAEVGHTDPKMTLGVYAGLVAFEAEDFGPLLGDLVGRGLESSPPDVDQEIAQAGEAR